MRRAAVLLAVGTALLAAGCGGSHPASMATARPQVNSASCTTSGGAGEPTTNTCTFVLNDGRRLGCNRDFVASRTLPALRRVDAGKHILLEHRGAVTIAWTRAPTGDLRSAVWRCVS